MLRFPLLFKLELQTFKKVSFDEAPNTEAVFMS